MNENFTYNVFRGKSHFSDFEKPYTIGNNAHGINATAFEKLYRYPNVLTSFEFCFSS